MTDKKKLTPPKKKAAKKKAPKTYKERFLAAKASKPGAYMTHKGGLILNSESGSDIDKAAKFIDDLIKPKKKAAPKKAAKKKAAKKEAPKKKAAKKSAPKKAAAKKKDPKQLSEKERMKGAKRASARGRAKTDKKARYSF